MVKCGPAFYHPALGDEFGSGPPQSVMSSKAVKAGVLGVTSQNRSACRHGARAGNGGADCGVNDGDGG